MSEIRDMMPAVTMLLANGQMPSADQVRRMLVVIDKQSDEIDRLTTENESLKLTFVELKDRPEMTAPKEDKAISRLKAAVALAANNFPESTDMEIRVVGKAKASVWVPAHVLQMLLDNSPL